MPLIADSTYIAPRFLPGGHLQTIYPTLFRGIDSVLYERERIETPDGDFLDLDWSRGGAPRLAILSHGLEGDSRRSYILGMARALRRDGWDVLAWNCRGCGGQQNRLLRSYHSGATDDLDIVVMHALSTGRYRSAALVGFSLGGNLTLKYLGERSPDPRIEAAVAFSVPCDLKSSALALARPANAIYMRRFLTSLRGKVMAKRKMLAFDLDETRLRGMRTFQEFDDFFTAPVHGFRDADDYWSRCSSRQFLPSLTVPTLMISAANDPFLAPECYPVEEARASSVLFLEMPRHGGHVGFVSFEGRADYWSEIRAVEFLKKF